jgi:hypothetical protein
MRRRGLLSTLALGALCAAWTGPLRAWLQPADGRPAGGAHLLAMLGRPESAAAVGRAFLAGHPAEADRSRLTARLERTLRGQGCDPAHDRSERLRAALAREIRADFAGARVVRVGGWVLSETEARLCGLAALSAA